MPTLPKKNADFGSIIHLHKGELVVGLGMTEYRAYEDLQTKIIIKESEPKHDVSGK